MIISIKMRILLLFLVAALIQGKPHRRLPGRHILDRRGPVAKSKLATVTTSDNLKKNEVDQPVDIPEVNAELNLKDGDLLQSPDSRSTVYDEQYLWPTNRIPIVYTSDITPLKRAVLDIGREEYEMKTCLTLPERTDEEDYITFRSLGGCFSYIGVIGGPQNISIGDGCERIGTIEHEIMHALGIFHEQSRTDRDDYVEIVEEKINPNSIGNFDKYDYDLINDRRVSYDYSSIMHYSKTGFTTDGNITIRTRDPAFQDTIGQRGGFSPGDVTKISRMYDCSEPIRKTFYGDFEDEAESGYTSYLTNSDVDWMQHKVGLSDTSGPVSRYLPQFDSTLGRNGEGSFMYLDTSKRFPGLSGVLNSRRYTTTVARQCLEFSYYMRLQAGSNAAFTVYIATLDDLSGEVISYGDPLQTFVEDSWNGVDEWAVHRMNVMAPKAFRIVFYAKTDSTLDVMAIDDVSITDKECETSHFAVEGYSAKASSMTVDEAIISPLMYTGNPGYAYQILVYPQGTQTAIDNGRPEYMSMYFRLCSGDYDDELAWPFDQQYIRLSIMDQVANPNVRVNALNNFIADKDDALRNASFVRPMEGGCNEPTGYSAFTQKEKFNSRMYLKHDVAYFSVAIRDMSSFVGVTDATLPNPTIEPPFEQQTYSVNSQNSVRSRGRSANYASFDDEEDEIPLDVGAYDDTNMMPISSAVIMILGTCLGVFLVMSMTICCVASSYKKKMEYRILLSRGINPLHIDTVKYSSLKGKI